MSSHENIRQDKTTGDIIIPPLFHEEDGNLVFNQDIGYDKTEVVIHDREYPVTRHEKIEGPPGPLHFGFPLADGVDPGVSAVSSALFARNIAFEQIPMRRRSVFRRRRTGEHNSDWSNSFPTSFDVLNCCNQIEYENPYPESQI
ncbi:photosensitized Ina-labeled protein PHIL1 [Cardiosporidium cionae]|uniref:Photosensitized Ina-labeled protein PHIL1 n=1 Tax=Cardiosporidium cionae TaxID=476202 RepID=A0ABQ7JAU2_9APIC|nr:photosensitized Ina-labeled protein PHIL1 [Cardiosporidium cionae]|eukprot:KAF8821039.1 photosensitized Ina-labeled protein PHIL1 [Cardiosporidium cionae]